MQSESVHNKTPHEYQDRYFRAKSIFLELLEIPADTRNHFIDQRCGTDNRLRELVEHFLHAEQPALDRLESLAHATSLAAPVNISPEIAGFSIGSLIAAGGTGLVFEAQQHRPNRRVAIKLIRPEFAAPGTLLRFEREAEILARLRHPYIAQVYGIGSAQLATCSVPYIAMELIRGPSLVQFLREQKLSVSERLQLLARICEGVHHAHLQGVIHRDLKPENILVDGDGHPRIVDFGIARALAIDGDVTLLTQHGQIIGTLPYMSPEQAGGDLTAVDARSDVYALGAIAFEVLSGQRPFEVDGFDILAAVKVITTTELPRLLIDGTRSQGDASAVVRAAMHRDVQRRYQSAHELQTDLLALAQGLPISVREPTLLYTLRGLYRRHRRWSIFALGAVLIVLAFSGVIFSLYKQQLRASRRAESAELLAQDTTRFVISEVNQRLQDVLGGAPIRREILRDAYERLAAAVEAEPNSRERREDCAYALTMLGTIDLELARHAHALERFESADQLLVALLAERPKDRKLLEGYSLNLIQFGNVAGARNNGSIDEQRTYFERALRIDEELVARYSQDIQLLNNLSWSYQRLGILAMKQDASKPARRFFEQQQDVARRLVAKEPESVPAMDALYDSIRHLEGLARRANDASARDYQIEAREIASDIYRREPRRPRSMKYEVRRRVEEGDDLLLAGDAPGAFEHYGSALDLAAELVEAEPGIDGRHHSYNLALFRFVKIAEDHGQVELANSLRHLNAAWTISGPRRARYSEIKRMMSDVGE